MSASIDASTIDGAQVRQTCKLCSLRELCWPMGLEGRELERLQSIVTMTGPHPAGSHLFRAGDGFTAIYAVLSGCVKSYSIDEDGVQHVHGFHLAGELLGFDAVYPDRHRVDAQVLEEAKLCLVPYEDISRLAGQFPSLQTEVIRLMSREFADEIRYAIGGGPEQKLAGFLLSLSSRFGRQGLPDDVFELSMSRSDIGSYLGFSTDTITNHLGKLRQRALIDVKRRRIVLKDKAGLEEIVRAD